MMNTYAKISNKITKLEKRVKELQSIAGNQPTPPMDGDDIVLNDINVTGTLIVTDTATFKCNVEIKGELVVNTAVVTGDNTLRVLGTSNLNNLNISGHSEINELIVNETATFYDDVAFNATNIQDESTLNSIDVSFVVCKNLNSTDLIEAHKFSKYTSLYSVILPTGCSATDTGACLSIKNVIDNDNEKYVELELKKVIQTDLTTTDASIVPPISKMVNISINGVNKKLALYPVV